MKRICPSCNGSISYGQAMLDIKTPGTGTTGCKNCKSIVKFKFPWWVTLLAILLMIPAILFGLSLGIIIPESLSGGIFLDETMVSMFTPGVLFLTVVIFLVVCMGIGLFLGTLTFVWGDVVTIPEKRGK